MRFACHIIGKARQFICIPHFIHTVAATQSASQIEIRPTTVKNHNYVKVKSQHHKRGLINEMCLEGRGIWWSWVEVGVCCVCVGVGRAY